ncbi:MAG: hypothetical protein GEU74_11540 [Nitriliruptorales bacterium]|nr:hypothetical protein [Nitriliruptorales bacterium]
MRRCWLGLVVVVVGVLAWAPPASAGGWWSSVRVDSRPLGAGETVTARSEAFFTTEAQAEAAHSVPYYAYLVRGYDRALLRHAMTRPDPKRWWALEPDAELIRVGRLHVGGWSGNVGSAHARIKLPAEISGRWNLMFCDAGCREPLGHAVPTVVGVTADPVTAQTARRTMALERRARRIVAQLRADVSNARAEAAEARAAARDLRRVLNDMTVDVQLLKAAQAQPDQPSPWRWTAGALVLGLVAGAWTFRRTWVGATPARGADRPDDSGWEAPARLVGSRRR